MARYLAPLHTSQAFLSVGQINVDADGILTVPDDAPVSDHDNLRRIGFTLEPAKTAPETDATEVADKAKLDAATKTAPKPPVTNTDGKDA